jgi:DNA-binding NtrC family response regulator
LDEIVERFRNSVIVRALALNHGNLERTADVLGIEYTELKGWMTRYGIKA